MPRRRISRYSRRTSLSMRRSRTVAVVVSVMVFLALCVLVSVIIGLALGRRAQENDNDKKYEFEKTEYQSGNKTVRGVEAYDYLKSDTTESFSDQGITDYSICLRRRDGALEYKLDISDKMEFDEILSETSLEARIDKVHGAGGYACVYLYLNSLECEDKYQREIYKAYEVALVAEAAACGADDIMLLGLSVTEANISEVEEFVARAAIAAGDTAIGVALPPETILLTEQEIYLASRVRNSCDFIALDLTEQELSFKELGTDGAGNHINNSLEEMLDSMEYYIKAYSMRTVFSNSDRELYRAAIRLGVVSFQVIE